MARSPAERYASAAAMADDLADFLAAEHTDDAASPRPKPRVVMLAVAALVVVGALAGLGLLVRGFGTEVSRAPAPGVAFERIVHGPGRKTSPSFSPDGRSLAYATDASGSWEIHLLELAGGVDPVSLTAAAPVGYQSPAFSPDGRSIAFVSLGRPGAIHVMDLAERTLRTVVERNASDLGWSADGREIFFTDSITDSPGTYAAKTKLYAVELASGRSRVLTGIAGSQLGASTAAGQIAFVAQGGGRTDIWTLSQAGGDAVRVTDDEALEWSPVLSAAGTEIFFGSDRDGAGRLFRVPIDSSGRPSGEPVAVCDAVFPAPFYLASGGAGDPELALVSTKHAGRLHRLMLDPGPDASVERVVALPNRYMAASFPVLSPDGRSLAFTAVTSQEDLAVGGPEGLEPRLLTEDAFQDRAPRWSPDGSRIAFQSDRTGNMEIWTIRPDGSDLVRRTVTAGDATLPVWSPDGAQLAFTVTGQGGFLTAEGGVAEPLPAWEDGGGPFEPSSWSPDGRMLAGTAQGIVVYSLSDRSYRRLTDFGSAPAWLDERRLLFTTDREIHLLDPRTGASHLLFSFLPARVEPSVSVSADGRTVHVSLSASPEEIWRIALRE
jgi:Tol biopolymer transport system component